MTAPASLLTAWAQLVAASLVASGVREVIVSPGSRSTPYALALARRSDVVVTSVVDERSAAFVALGMARASGRPAAVLATSGSAPAHWFPAVIEAATANVPLVLLSADRPLALAHTGAAQTIDQTKLFGSWVRFFADLGDPRDDDAALDGAARTVAQAVACARTLAGPVHLNLRADKPLEPVELDEALAARIDLRIARGVSAITSGAPSADETFAQSLASALAGSERPLAVAGPRPASSTAIAPALTVLGLPIAAEASSQLRFGERPPCVIDAFEHLFSTASFARRAAPDLVLQIGSLPTPSIYGAIAAGVPRFVLDAGGIRDPIGGAAAISLAGAAATLARVAELTTRRPAWSQYCAALSEADALAWAEVERVLGGPFGEGAAVRAGVGCLPDDAILVVGNSLPIRTLDRFVRGTSRHVQVLSQRGVNGIDGLVAGAVGAALVSARPVLAIVGDVSLLHDVGSLLALARVETPIVVLVIDNAGGRIFEELPIARDPRLGALMPLFTTPHDVDFGALAGAYGLPFVEARDASAVAHATRDALARAGATLLRAVVPPHEASESLAALRRAVAEVLA